MRRLIPWLVLVLGPLALLTGCDGINNEPYPQALHYPPRQDLLVTHEPKNTVLFFYAEEPGRLEQGIARIRDEKLEGGEVVDPKDMPAKEQGELTKFLDDTFGTPAKPTVHVDDDDLKPLIEELLLDDTHLADGSKLFRRHCLQCHGVSGDGRGPSGPWLHPHPRDYRQGMFKFVSSAGQLPRPGQPLDIKTDRKPRRDDLRRILEVGVEGTSMPSFAILPEKDRESLISYVTHLSVRGEVEYYVIKQTVGKKADPMPDEAQKWLETSLKNWSIANKSPLIPKKPAPPANNEERLKSVARGYEQFIDSKGGNCVSCHFDFGRQAQFRYDSWGTLVRPNNLTAGTYRGGRRPIDLFWRVRGGITPCAMPATADEDKVWDLVNFVQALPYPELLPESVKHKVYPSLSEKKLAER